MNGKKILVTGANGYIGSKVVDLLCRRGCEVLATDLGNNHINRKALFIKANIFEQNDDWFSFFNAPDVCLHLAWRDGFVHNSTKHLEDLNAHFSFLTNLISNGLKHIAVMGTMHEIGYWEGPVDEYTPCNPLSLYGISKNALRQAVKIVADSNNCVFQWLRAFYIFGDDTYGNSIFCKITKAAQSGIKEFPFTSGKNMCDFIHVDDLATQIVDSIVQEEVNGIINVCSGKPVSLSEQVEWYIKHKNFDIKLKYGEYPDRPYDSPCIYGDNLKIQTIFKNKHS